MNGSPLSSDFFATSEAILSVSLAARARCSGFALQLALLSSGRGKKLRVLLCAPCCEAVSQPLRGRHGKARL